MKKLILSLILVSAGLFAFAQIEGTEDIPVNVNTQLITFQEVVDQPGTKKELFYRASEWINHYFKQPVYVTQVRDDATGLIKGKHQFELYYYENDIKMRAGIIKYYFKLECKEGRYRYTLDNFVLAQQSKYPCERWLDTTHRDYNPQWSLYLEQIRAYVINDFVASLKEYMIPQVIVEEEEW